MSHLTQLFEAARFPDGVEVHTDSISATMTLDGPEHGSLRLFPLAPGVILSFNRIYTQVWPLAQTEAANILLLNFCLNGRCEVDLDNGQFAFLSQGSMALGTQQVKAPYRYPSGVYEGVELFLDLDALDLEPYCLFLEAGIDLSALIQHFQAVQKLYLAQTPTAVQGTLSQLWELRDTEDVGDDEARHRPAAAGTRAAALCAPIPRIRYFTLSPGKPFAQGGTLHSPIRSQPKSHGTGTGGAVSDRGDQFEELFPRGVRGKISPPGSGRPGCAEPRSCCGTRTCGWRRLRNRWAMKIRASLRRFLPGSSAVRHWNIEECLDSNEVYNNFSATTSSISQSSIPRGTRSGCTQSPWRSGPVSYAGSR